MPLTLADCSERPEETSGVYIIYPGGVDTIYPTAVQVYCDQTTDGGGWTVFLRRQKQEPQLNFSRTFKDYKEGFGSPSGEYWLGLENLHRLTTTKTMEMRAVIVRGVNRASGRYLDFKVEGGDEYTLRVGGYDNVSSSAFDALTYHDGRQFSTIDRDRDSKSDQAKTRQRPTIDPPKTQQKPRFKRCSETRCRRLISPSMYSLWAELLCGSGALVLPSGAVGGCGQADQKPFALLKTMAVLSPTALSSAILGIEPYMLLGLTSSIVKDGIPFSRPKKHMQITDGHARSPPLPLSAEPPLTSEPPLSSELPLSSEPPLTSEPPLSSELPLSSDLPLTSEPPLSSEPPLISQSSTITPQQTTVPFTPADCSERPEKTSGVYTIYPSGAAVQVYCDQTTNGGGWTVFLRRQKQEPQLNFSRTFKEYEEGFGSPSGEYWLGLEDLHLLTTTRPQELRAVIVRGVNRTSARYLDLNGTGGAEEEKLSVSCERDDTQAIGGRVDAADEQLRSQRASPPSVLEVAC
ncbi:uncharacterized protein LOC108670708 [Hyalella azteca]|uniref:Uncharacterized protein LOC108670708 n=1 Tax=Hyalella azteca TaxID=294128 RepID=A0A8B7NJ60_HYAAZ|nr:uncharacterized protein LOC108670708 [Hyalella azteca]